MSDHITECPCCWSEIQIPCEFANAATEADALRAKLRDRERRIRKVRDILSVALGPMGLFEDSEELLTLLDLRRKGKL